MPEGPVFNTVAEQLRYERALQQDRYNYKYELNGDVNAGETSMFTVDIESGADFKLLNVTGSAYGYNGETDSVYPMPLIDNAGAVVASFPMRGLQVQITDSNSGRRLTSGFVSFETIFTPGYGVAFMKPYDMRYLFYRNDKIVFDIRNTEPANGLTHSFSITLNGYRYETLEPVSRN